jgi:arsenate reductase
MSIQLIHNPHCSKSCATLALLRERGHDVHVIEYLVTPPDAARLDWLLQRLALEPREFMRRDEPIYAELGLDDASFSRADLIAAMVAHPVLIQRPVAINGERVAIGRPPENVLTIV